MGGGKLERPFAGHCGKHAVIVCFQQGFEHISDVSIILNN